MDINKHPAAPDGTVTSDNFPLGSTLLVVSAFFMTFVGRTILSPLLLTIEMDMGISHAEGGTFFLLISIGLMTSMLLSGFILQYITHHQNIALSAVLCGLSLYVLASVEGLLLFRIGLLLLGAGSGLYMPSGIVTITEIVPVHRRGIGIAVHEIGAILGLAAGPFFAELALRFADWRTFMFIIGTASLVTGVVYARFGGGGRFNGTPPLWSELSVIIKKRDFWIIAFFFIMAIGNEVGVYSMLPTYLVVDRGIDKSLVNAMVGTSRLTSLLMIFTAGVLADRFGYKRVIAVVSVVCGIVTAALGFVGGPLIIAVVFLQPMLVSAFFPAGFIALAGVSTPKQRNLPVSLIIPLALLFGGGMVPAIIGHLAERGAFGLGFVVVGITMAAGVVLVPLLKTQVRQW